MSEKGKELTLAKNLAKSRGGKCLSRKYVNSKNKMKWECEQGHKWEAAFGEVKGTSKRKGTWCPYCHNRVDKKSELQKCIENRKIKALSKKYILSSTKYKWECLICSHIWKATHNNIKRGKGCPKCGHKKRKESQSKYSINDLQNKADERNGICLDKKYNGYHHKYRFQCSLGHEWQASASSILRTGTWCPYCAGQRGFSIVDAQNLAKERGGKCLSKRYINTHRKLNWECSEGHAFKMAVAQVKLGQWCSQCNSGLGERITRYYFEKLFNEKFPSIWPDWLKGENGRKLELDGYNEMLSIAFEHQGIHHYKQIKFFQDKEKKHESQKIRDDIKVATCRKKRIKLIVVPQIPTLLKIEEIPFFLEKEFNKKKIKYSKTKLHQIDPFMAYKTKVDKVLILKALAFENEGELLSKNYLGTQIKYKWKCGACSNIFEAYPGNIRKGRWCPKCGRIKQGKSRLKETLKDAQVLAKKFGGKFLDHDYKGRTFNHRWKCKKGHKFQKSLREIKGYSNRKGTFCPKCAEK